MLGALPLVERLQAREDQPLVRRRAAEAEADDREHALDVRLLQQDLLRLSRDRSSCIRATTPAGAWTMMMK